jgi:hypothetical protein
VGSLTSHNPIGLHGHLPKQQYIRASVTLDRLYAAGNSLNRYLTKFHQTEAATSALGKEDSEINIKEWQVALSITYMQLSG